MSHVLSRRGFLKGLAVSAGAVAGARLAGGPLVGRALAAGAEQPAVVIIHFIGGYNAIFGSAQSLLTSTPNNFGVAAGNFTALGNGVSLDNSMLPGLTPFAKQHVAVLGVRHGISSHTAARNAIYTDGGSKCHILELAAAMGGSAPIKAAALGGPLRNVGNPAPISGVSLQPILDMKTTVQALSGTASPRIPSRDGATAGLTAAQALSQHEVAVNPQALDPMTQGFTASIATLKQAPKTLDLAGIQTAYGLGATTAVRDFKSKLAAAELMIQAGSNVVTLFDEEPAGNWDYHNDVNGTLVRNRMRSEVVTPLNTFLGRMLNDPARNVVVAILGDFSRSLPGSDHQPNLSATVLGKYCQLGTTGKVNADVALPAGTPSIPGFWAYLAAASKTAGAPFGANPHGLVA